MSAASLKKIVVIDIYGVMAKTLYDSITNSKKFKVTFVEKKQISDKISDIAASDLIIVSSIDLIPSSVISPKSKIIELNPKFKENDSAVMGLPEVGLSDKIAEASRVFIPNPFTQAAILAIKPLVDFNLMSYVPFLTVTSIGGYTCGGLSAMHSVKIGEFSPMSAYLNKPHGSISEIKRFTGYSGKILGFSPIIGSHPRGIYLEVNLPFSVPNITDAYLDSYLEYNISVLELPFKISLEEGASSSTPTIYVKSFEDYSKIVCVFDNIDRSYGSLVEKIASLMIN